MLGLPRHFWHSVQWCWIDLTACRPLKIQKRLLISAKTRSIPGWCSCVSYYLIRSLVTGWIGSKTIGCRIWGLSKWHCLSLPPTLISWLSGSNSGANVFRRLFGEMGFPAWSWAYSSGKLYIWDLWMTPSSAFLYVSAVTVSVGLAAPWRDRVVSSRSSWKLSYWDVTPCSWEDGNILVYAVPLR